MSDIVVRLRDIAIEDKQIVLPRSKEALSRPYLGLEQIESNTGRILKYETSSAEGKSSTFAFDTSHVLYGKLRPYLNKVAIPERAGRCSTEIIPLLPQGVDREFLAFLLRTEQVVSAAMSEKTGSRMPRADMDALLDVEVLIPGSEAQQRIISGRLRGQLAAVEQARQAAQAQAKDADHLIRRYREGFLDELANAEVVHLGNLIERIEAGKSIQTSERLATDEELAVLKVSAVSWAEFRPSEAKAIDRAYKPDDRHRIRAGDLLVSRANTIELVGAVVRVDRDYPFRLLSDKTLRLVVNVKLVDPDYLVQVLRMQEAREYIERNATGTSDSMRNISQEALKATPVRLPSLAIQRQISKRAHDIESILRRLQLALDSQIADVESLPGRFLSQAFAKAEYAKS